MKKLIISIVMLSLFSCGKSRIDVKLPPQKNTPTIPNDFCEGKESLAPFAAGDGTSLDPFIICSHAQLNEVGNDPSYLNLNFKLGADIDLSSYIANDFNKIGGTNCATESFTGVFDGDNREISNLTFNQAETWIKIAMFPCFNGELKNVTFNNFVFEGDNDVGVIGTLGFADATTTAVVENVTIEDSNFTGKFKVGGLSGESVESTVTNLTVTNSVINNNDVGVTDAALAIGYCISDVSVSNSVLSGIINHLDYVGSLFGQARGNCSGNGIVANATINANSFVGGLVGVNDGGVLSNSQVTATIIATGNNVGGVLGRAWFCNPGLNFVSISSSGSVSGANNVGGAFGAIDNWADCQIEKVGTSSSVSVDTLGAGGFVGSIDGSNSISDSFATGNVNSLSGNVKGGFAGYWIAGNISNSFATGMVDNGANLGGFSADYTAGVCNNCYFSDNTGLAFSDDGQASLESDMDMRAEATFVGFDFVNNWEIDEGVSYPTLIP